MWFQWWFQKIYSNIIIIQNFSLTQSKYFPTIKTVHIIEKNGKVDTNTVNAVVDSILPRFAPMKIKIVVGKQLFKRKQNEIKESIENSTHFA